MTVRRPFFGPIRTLIVSAALWLPLAFVVWFYFKQLFAFPVFLGAEAVMKAWMPDVVKEAEAGFFANDAVTGKEPAGQVLGSYHHRFTINAPVNAERIPGTDVIPKRGVIEMVADINPLIYGYSVPLLAGLIFVTPLTRRRKLLQCAIGFVVLLPQQIYGVCADLVQKLVFLGTPETAAVILDQGLSKTAIALAYQFGYLMLPPILPIVLWVLMNRTFVERLVVADASGEVWIDEDEPSATGDKT